MVAEVHQGDVGTVVGFRFRNEVGAIVVVADATVKRIVLRNPSGRIVTQTLAFTTDGADGKGRSVSRGQERLMAPGKSVEGYVELPGGKWHSGVPSTVRQKYRIAPVTSTYPSCNQLHKKVGRAPAATRRKSQY